MAERKMKGYEGLLNRLSQIISLTGSFPDKITDDEVEGMLYFLPDDLIGTMKAFLNPRVRDVGVEFLKTMGAWLDGAFKAKEEGKKVFLVPFNFVPEILHCFEGAWPITSEVVSTVGVTALDGQGERYWDYAMGLGLPDFSCSANMIEVGSALTETDFRPDAIVSDCLGSCDINSKTHEFLSRYLNIPLFFLEKPVDDTERGIKQYYRYFETMIEEIEEFLGEKLDEDRMRAVIKEANRASELYWELWDLSKHSPCPAPNIFSLMVYAIRYSMWGTEEGTKAMAAMVDKTKERLEKKEYPAETEIARAVWSYTSYYFDMAGFFNWMEENGITHLGDGLDLVFPQEIDTTSRETMIRGVAEIARNMPMTRQMGASSMSTQWLEDVAWAARELDANCIIYCGHHSCKQTWSASSIVRTELMKRLGLPTLVLQGDSWIRRMTPMSVLQENIQEFVNNAVKQRDARARVVG